MVKIRYQYVTGSARKVIKGVNNLYYITVHDTQNYAAGANAAAHANLQSRGNSRNASWTVTIDDVEAVVSYYPKDRVMHAGDGNGTGNLSTMAIEICVNNPAKYPQAIKNAQEYIALMLSTHKKTLKHGDSTKSVVGHVNWSGKNCPKWLRAGTHGITWSNFLTGIAKLVNSPVNPSVPDVPDVNTMIGSGEMFVLINNVIGDKRQGTGYLVVPNGSGKPQAAILGAQDVLTSVPIVEYKWARSLEYARRVIDGIDG